MPNANSAYLETRNPPDCLRLPLEGNIDLTYRCNNKCLHCWIRATDSCSQGNELTFEEIKHIVIDAKRLGCRSWGVSGGEPLLRQDFPEIFTFLQRNSLSLFLSTNGTLVTPKIASLLKEGADIMVALYGATAAICDHITQRKGSFDQALRGFNYLKEAGCAFAIQVVPLKDNFHQYKDMVSLARSFTKYFRIGSPWLYLSQGRDKLKNAGILRQRLNPSLAAELERPDVFFEDADYEIPGFKSCSANGLFASCITKKQGFHIDPYGKMSFCNFVKGDALRYDLKRGNFQEGWEKFIPGLKEKIQPTESFFDNCGKCEKKDNCKWCPAYGYLEHADFSSKVTYLCDLAEEQAKFKQEWRREHRRFYKVADVTLQVDSEIPISDSTFNAKFRLFETPAKGADTVAISHHFMLPELDERSLGKLVYRRPPWAVYKREESWVYMGISPEGAKKNLTHIAIFDRTYSRGRIFSDNADIFLKGNLHSLTMFSTDQILLAQILADRKAFYVHACGAELSGKGMLFAGNSGAGKSTLAALLKEEARIFNDDRVIIRQREEGFQIFGSWSNGEYAHISPGGAPLGALIFLKKAEKNCLLPVKDKRKIASLILNCTIKPLVTVDWWDKTLSLIDALSQGVPCYTLHFNKNAQAVTRLLKQL